MIRIVTSKDVEGIHGKIRYQVMYGDSDDSKPTTGLATGSKFIEVDTGDEYIYDETSTQWTKTASGGGGITLQYI